MKHGTLRRKTKKQKAGIWRSYKDRLFCRLFSEPENALSLVNAVCGTSYTDAADLRIVTLEDAIYLSRKNDLAVCFGNQLVLFEQQSTDNPNMPLRGLFYFAREYEGMLKEMELNPFSERLVRLPAPQYYVLYNGEKALPEQMEYRLSQAFDRPAEGYEWTAKVININAGCQSELMRRCPSLRGYAELIARIRAGQQNGLEFGAAVDEAVDSCIADGFLAEFLKKHKGEVKSMFLTGVDPKWYARIVRKEAREDGREQMSELILRMIQSGHEDDIKRVAEDSDYRSAMLRQYGIEE